jgi:hypothetical protein
MKKAVAARFWPALSVASLLMNGLLFTALAVSQRPVAPTTAVAPLAVGPASASKSAPSPAAWNTFQDENLLQLGVRLRDSGFPIPVVREILFARIAEQPATERAAIRFALQKGNPQLAAEFLRDRPNEGGPSLFEAPLRRQYGDLSEEKTKRLQQLLDDYNKLRRQLWESRDRDSLSHAPEHQLLEKAQEDDIARLLTPPEFFEYELRSSQTARQMRRLLYSFDATEAEFRALFPLFRELGFQGPPASSAALISVAMRDQWTKIAEPGFQARIEQVLSPDRFADFRRATSVALKPSGGTRTP